MTNGRQVPGGLDEPIELIGEPWDNMEPLADPPACTFLEPKTAKYPIERKRARKQFNQDI